MILFIISCALFWLALAAKEGSILQLFLMCLLIATTTLSSVIAKAKHDQEDDSSEEAQKREQEAQARIGKHIKRYTFKA